VCRAGVAEQAVLQAGVYAGLAPSIAGTWWLDAVMRLGASLQSQYRLCGVSGSRAAAESFTWGQQHYCMRVLWQEQAHVLWKLWHACCAQSGSGHWTPCNVRSYS
jgi:hypothetical protein